MNDVHLVMVGMNVCGRTGEQVADIEQPGV